MIINHKMLATEYGFDGNMAFEYIFAKMQDVITLLFGNMGCDNITLRSKYHSMWVFTKQKAKVFKRPTWNDEVVFNSRIVKANRLIAYIKTEMFDKDNNLLIEGLTECCVIDVDTFKFVKLTDIPFNMENEECETSFEFAKFEGQETYPKKVLTCLTDMSKHLNNAKTLFLLVDTLGIERVKEVQKHQFELGIKYTKQAFHNMDIDFILSENCDGFLFKIVNNDEILQEGYIKYLD